jgi:hypothetical protein
LRRGEEIYHEEHKEHEDVNPAREGAPNIFFVLFVFFVVKTFVRARMLAYRVAGSQGGRNAMRRRIPHKKREDHEGLT